MAEIKGKNVKIKVNQPIVDGDNETKTSKVKKFKTNNMEFKKDVIDNKKLLTMFMEDYLKEGSIPVNLTEEEKKLSKELFLDIIKEISKIENGSFKYCILEIIGSFKKIFKEMIYIIKNLYLIISNPFKNIINYFKKIIKQNNIEKKLDKELSQIVDSYNNYGNSWENITDDPNVEHIKQAYINDGVKPENIKTTKLKK